MTQNYNNVRYFLFPLSTPPANLGPFWFSSSVASKQRLGPHDYSPHPPPCVRNWVVKNQHLAEIKNFDGTNLETETVSSF